MILNNWLILANKVHLLPASVKGARDDVVFVCSYKKAGLITIGNNSVYSCGSTEENNGIGVLSTNGSYGNFSSFPLLYLGESDNSTELTTNKGFAVESIENYGVSGNNTSPIAAQGYGSGTILINQNYGASLMDVLYSVRSNHANPFGCLALEVSDESGDITVYDYDLEHNITRSVIGDLNVSSSCPVYSGAPGGPLSVTFPLSNPGSSDLTIRQVGLSKAGTVFAGFDYARSISWIVDSTAIWDMKWKGQVQDGSQWNNFGAMTCARAGTYEGAHKHRLLLSKYNLSNPITLQPGKSCSITFNLSYFDPNAPVITNL